MKLKLLLFFLVVVGFSLLTEAQTKKPYNNLLITEAQIGDSFFNYVEITNMGNETIELSNFEFGRIDAWTVPYNAPATQKLRFPSKTLAPGKSYLISAAFDHNPRMFLKNPEKWQERMTRPEFYKIADLLLHFPESTPLAKEDLVSAAPTPYQVIEAWGGRDCFYLRHHFLNDQGLKDSVVVDQVGGVFDEANGTNMDAAGYYSVAGVERALFTHVLIRKNSIKTGNVDFNAGRGIDLADSEWIPIPHVVGWNRTRWAAVWWTAGNQVNATLDATTLVPKRSNVTVDFAKGEITVPWGVRRDDSLMYQFQKKPGLAWTYIYAPNTPDSAFISARTGDILKVIACGDKATIKDFKIIVKAPTADDNIVVPKYGYNNTRKRYEEDAMPYSGYRVTHGITPIDTIRNIDFATRVDTLFKYIEKAPKASWQIVYKSGVAKPDLTYGDILRVTSESGKAKDYFLKLEKFYANSNALLSSITWPDMPKDFKGAIASSYGWVGDTIPNFKPTNNDYVVKVPLDYSGIPALTFTKQNVDATVKVDRAKNLEGTVADRTVTITVTAERDTIKTVYRVRFDKEQDYRNVQPFKADPFISQIVMRSEWSTNFIELANPGTEPIDLSNYMIRAAYGTESGTWNWNNEATTAGWNGAYMKYIPGKKWQDEANWIVQPRVAVPDLAVNAIVYPADVFVMAQLTNAGGWLDPATHPYLKEIDVNFGVVPNKPNLSNPWGRSINWNNVAGIYFNNNIFLYKILNDSVKNGLKPATNRLDFELIESFGGVIGGNWVVGGVNGNQRRTYVRKPHIYKGNPEPNGSWGTTRDNSEWIETRPEDYQKFTWPNWWGADVAICTGIGSHTMNEVTIYRSTVSSKVYKVSPGFSKKETIRGLTTGTTVTTFMNNILKADPNQTVTLKSAANGSVLAPTAAITKGDSLIVVSADLKNTSKYVIDVTTTGLSNDALLTSTLYTVKVTGTTGTIEGFKTGTFLKNIVAGIKVPVGASMTMVDEMDAYVTLTKVRYDTTYINVLATNKIYFEVIAENGTTKILYQLKPTANPSDAYVTSDVYSVDQFASLIQFVPGGTAVNSLIKNVTPAPGATVVVYDKFGHVRTTGDIYRDDKLIVTSQDGKTTKAYYFSMLNFFVNKYLAYVISDDYLVNQINFTITGPLTTSKAEFFAKLYPSFGAVLSIVNKDGVVNTSTSLNKGDKLVVTAADGLTKATYNISVITKAIEPTAEIIKIYPNPTSDGRVIVQGLTKGNRVQVFNAAGVTLRDVVVENATDYVSLAAQPAGIYVFVVSSNDKYISIQKIVKR